MKALAILASALIISGCSTPVTQSQVQNANFSEKPTDTEAFELIKSYLQNTLIDPNSLILKCSPVTGKGWARYYMTDKPTFGYLVLCSVNAKNKLGGYTGQTPYMYVINGRRISDFEFNPQAWAKGELYDVIK